MYTRFPRKEHSPWRNWGSRFTHRMANLVLDKPPDLYLSSFRCITALVAREIGRYDGAFPYIDGLILQTTQNIGQLEVAHDKRQEGQSGYTLSKLVHLWSSMLVNFSIRPLQVATVIGVLLAALGFAGAAWMVVAYFFQDYPPGWGTLICSLLIFSGTQLIMLGVVGEYLGRLYLNMNRKPQAVIRDLSTNVKPD